MLTNSSGTEADLKSGNERNNIDQILPKTFWPNVTSETPKITEVKSDVQKTQSSTVSNMSEFTSTISSSVIFPITDSLTNIVSTNAQTVYKVEISTLKTDKEISTTTPKELPISTTKQSTVISTFSHEPEKPQSTTIISTESQTNATIELSSIAKSMSSSIQSRASTSSTILYPITNETVVFSQTSDIVNLSASTTAFPKKASDTVKPSIITTSTTDLPKKAPDTVKPSIITTSTTDLPKKASDTFKPSIITASTTDLPKKAPYTVKPSIITTSTTDLPKKASDTLKPSIITASTTDLPKKAILTSVSYSTSKSQKFQQESTESLEWTKRTSKLKKGVNKQSSSISPYQMKVTSTFIPNVSTKPFNPINDLPGPTNTTLAVKDASLGATALVLVVILPFLTLFLIAIILVLKKKCKKKSSKRKRNTKEDVEMEHKDNSQREPLTKSNNDA